MASRGQPTVNIFYWQYLRPHEIGPHVSFSYLNPIELAEEGNVLHACTMLRQFMDPEVHQEFSMILLLDHGITRVLGPWGENLKAVRLKSNVEANDIFWEYACDYEVDFKRETNWEATPSMLKTDMTRRYPLVQNLRKDLPFLFQARLWALASQVQPLRVYTWAMTYRCIVSKYWASRNCF